MNEMEKGKFEAVLLVLLSCKILHINNLEESAKREETQSDPTRDKRSHLTWMCLQPNVYI